MSAATVLVILAGGFVAGVLNTLAGGGSLITLPLLIFAGLPGGLANGTNRVAVVVQSAAAAASFRAAGVEVGGQGRRLFVPALLGAAAGALAAARLEDRQFERALAWVLLVMAVVVLASPERWVRPPGARLGRLRAAALWGSVLVLGAYAGFVQAGVGVLLLAALVGLGGHDLLRANAVKVVLVAGATVVSLAIFWWHGQVDWVLGLVLAAGMGVGGWAGARLQLRRGHGWVRLAVVIAVAGSGLKLLGAS